MSELDRREFLKIVGLSAGAAAAAGCSDPAEKLIPYVVQPETITPGIAVDGKPVYSVQYHPEASPGPQDSFYLFERFAEAMKSRRAA